jgi:FtsP/CotA-like multicopper oxidase with cupredoxin domain
MSMQVMVCANADGEFAVPIVAVEGADQCPGDFPELVEFGPQSARLGTVTGSGASATGNPLGWADASDPNNVEKTVVLQNGTNVMVNVTENPALNALEQWNMYNFTEDAHPIHLHLVRFQVMGREVAGETSPRFDATANGGVGNIGQVFAPEPSETGYKDTVIAYPGEITKVKARFDIPGLYVWHCHIVEHEDNEMMRPYVVSQP